MKMCSLKIMLVVLALCAARSVLAVNELQALKTAVTAYGNALNGMAYVLEETLCKDSVPDAQGRTTKVSFKDGVETVLETNGVITPGLHGADATVNLNPLWTVDPLDDIEDPQAIIHQFSFKTASDNAAAKRLDLIAKVTALNNAVAASSRFSNWWLCNGAKEAIKELERVRADMVVRFILIANAVGSVDLGDQGADIGRYALLNTNKLALQKAIHKIAEEDIGVNIYAQVNALQHSVDLFPTAVYSARTFVQNNHWWFIGGGATAIVFTGALAYLMRDRLSFRNLPLLGWLFRKRQQLPLIDRCMSALLVWYKALDGK